MTRQVLCAYRDCGRAREWHQYPMPQRDHIFTPEGSKPMDESRVDYAAPPRNKRKARLPCAICGKQVHTAGRWGTKFDHEYQPMAEKAAAARAATQGGAEVMEDKPRRGRPRKAAPSADELRRRRTAKSLNGKKAERASARREQLLKLAAEIVGLQSRIEAATAEMEELFR